MRFLADQDVYWATIAKLREWGHDVITAKEIGLHRASDEDLLLRALETSRVLLTLDKDFGTLVFLRKIQTAGVFFLRMDPSSAKDVHDELLRFLQEHSEAQLSRSFCVIERNRHRIRKIGA